MLSKASIKAINYPLEIINEVKEFFTQCRLSKGDFDTPYKKGFLEFTSHGKFKTLCPV